MNEPARDYAAGSADRATLTSKVAELAGRPTELPMTIGGASRMAGGDRITVVQPHSHRAVLGETAQATHADVAAAVDAALGAADGWRELAFDERAAGFLRAPDLLSTTWRHAFNAATMLGQSKTVQQAEIDAACELIDFWRYNVRFARDILESQPQGRPIHLESSGLPTPRRLRPGH